MASFTFRKLKGRYYARISEKGRTPRRKSWPLDTTQKMTAQKRLNRLRKAFDRGDWDPWEGGWLTPEPVPLKDAISEFLDAKSHLRPRTQDTYEGILRRFRKGLPPGSMLQDVELSDVEGYIRASGLASATQHKRFRHLRTFFNWAVDNDLMEKNPLDDMTPPKKERKEKAFLRPEDVKALLSTIETHILEVRDVSGRIPDLEWLYRMIQVAVATGLRRGELVALQWEDVNLEDRSIHVRHRGEFRTKGNSERRVPIRGEAEKALVQMHEPDVTGPVFTDRDGKPIRAGRVTTRFKDMAREADLDERIHFHSLRHTTGSWLSMQGVPLRHIQTILGHSSQSVTEQYSHLAPETLDRAMEETFGDSDR
jgi:site-specific recombinase XerD